MFDRARWTIGTMSAWFSGNRRGAQHRQSSRKPIIECLEERTLPDAGLPHLLNLPQDKFISGAYNSLLERAPRSEEVSQATKLLASGQSRTDVLAKILVTRAYVTQPGGWLANLYEDVLGRAADARSLAAWKTALKQGVRGETIARSLLNSKEFRSQMVTAYVEAADAGAPSYDVANAISPLLVQVKSGVKDGLKRLANLAGRYGAGAEPTDVAGLFRIDGSATALTQLTTILPRQSFIKYVEAEQNYQVDVAPNDPKYTDGTLWGMKGTYGVNAGTAWDVTTGSTKVVVATIDTGADYNHPDLYKNIWINQGEIPSSWYVRSSAGGAYNQVVSKAQVKDSDGDAKITFWDLNDSVNAGLVWDNNADGRIDAGDILLPRSQGGWEDGVDNSSDGYIDDLVGWNFVARNNKPFDDNKHGTHVAGTIGAIGNNGVAVVGVNWTTQIMPLKFLDASGSGSSGDAASAIRYAADHGAKVSNNSWGGGSADSTLRSAISYAGTKGHILAVAAGNDGRNISVTPSYPASYHLSNMVVVAATDSGGNLASFSNYSSSLVDVAAPGVTIYSTLPGNSFGNLSGTSMATPHVTGIVALVAAAQPNLTMTQIIGQVVNNTTALGSLSGKVVTGGLVNAAKAVGSSTSPGIPATPDTPTWTATSSSNGFLTWNPVSGTTSYLVQYLAASGTWTLYTTVSSPTANVAAGYYYRVAASNASGTSSFSARVYAAPQDLGQPPATPSQPTWSSAGGRAIQLSWNAVAGATSYEVQWWNSSIGSWTSGGTYSETCVQLSFGLGYYWHVRALNAQGASGYSPYVLAGQAPSQPTWSWAGGYNINLSWNDVGATSYVVQYWNFYSRSWVTLGTCATTFTTIYYGYGYYWRVGAVYSTSDPLFSSYVLAW